MLFAGNIGDHPSFGIFSTHLSGTLSTFWAYLCVIGPLHVAVTVVGWYLAASDASPDRLYPTSSLSSDDISSTSGRSQRLFSRCSTTNNNRATLSLLLSFSLSLSLSLSLSPVSSTSNNTNCFPGMAKRIPQLQLLRSFPDKMPGSSLKQGKLDENKFSPVAKSLIERDVSFSLF